MTLQTLLAKKIPLVSGRYSLIFLISTGTTTTMSESLLISDCIKIGWGKVNGIPEKGRKEGTPSQERG